MSPHNIIIRHSGLRQIAQKETIEALNKEEHRQPRNDFSIDMQPFFVEVETGDWDRQARYIREKAIAIGRACDEIPGSQVHYFGLSEIPHVIAFGAYWGDERHTKIHEFDRDANSWIWPSKSSNLSVILEVIPNGPKITAPGIAVIRISISAEIAEQDVNEAVGQERLADIALKPGIDKQSQITLVRSAKDLETIRLGFRKALAALQEHFPNLDTIHLFVAAPNSVCFAIGQELKPRNFFPIQTYRFRVKPGENRYQPAILILSEELPAPIALTTHQIDIAQYIRKSVWSLALKSLDNFKLGINKKHSQSDSWYSTFQPIEPFRHASPFRNLPPLFEVLPDTIEVDLEPYKGNELYRFDKDSGRWQLHDRLLANLGSIFPMDDPGALQIIRLFLIHEHLHDHHCLTADTAIEVGKFQNCLEYMDYAADTYSLFHEFNITRNFEKTDFGEEKKNIQILANLIEHLIKSFWAFEQSEQTKVWEVRRLRRYLNWYWRHIQVKRATRFKEAITVVSNPPKIEIAGLRQKLRGRRVMMVLDQFDPTSELEMGIVLENEKFFRVSQSANSDLSALLNAFCDRNHAEICNFFRSIFEFSRQVSGQVT